MLHYQVYVQSDLLSGEAESRLAYDELPAIELHLLFTCLETLASSNFRPFPDWLEARPDAQNLTAADVRSLYEQYKNECGTTKNIRRLFQNLPPSAVVWLSENVTLRREDAEAELWEVQSDTRIVVDRLYRYFNDIQRNTFTHEGTSAYAYKSDDIASGERWASSLYFFGDKDNRRWHLLFREGIDAVTVLRVILQALVLQRLGVEVSSIVIQAYVSSLARQRAMHGFLHEIGDNARAVAWWPTFDPDGRHSLNSYLAFAGVPSLTEYWPSRLASRLNDYPLEQGLSHFVTEYQRALTYLNAAIDEFNQTHPPLKAGEAWDQKGKEIAPFLAALAKTREYKIVTETPLNRVWNNLRLVARNPCYT